MDESRIYRELEEYLFKGWICYIFWILVNLIQLVPVYYLEVPGVATVDVQVLQNAVSVLPVKSGTSLHDIKEELKRLKMPYSSA